VANLTPDLADLTLWISFFFSLLLFSLVAGDNLLARLAQYVLVGVSIGYLGALAIQHVLRPRLFTPLLNAPIATLSAAPQLWIGLVLGLLLFGAGLERMAAQAPPDESSQPDQHTPKGWQRLLRTAGMIPAALMLGVGVAVVFIGILQGTFWPLFWQTAQSGLNWSASLSTALTSVLILCLTTATLLAWAVPLVPINADQPAWVRYLLSWWAGLGKRALWFSAGVLFARLFAGHLSLLIARLEFFIDGLNQSSLWQWAEMIWRGISGS
jgi:hypothetical protein